MVAKTKLLFYERSLSISVSSGVEQDDSKRPDDGSIPPLKKN